MEEKVNYRSAFSCALAYVHAKEIMASYENYFQGQKIEYTSKANLQNCILFAGALFDELVGYDEAKTKKYRDYRIDIQGDIAFIDNHVKVIKKVLKDIANAIARKDYKLAPQNISHYQETYNKSKKVIDEIHEEEENYRKHQFEI